MSGRGRARARGRARGASEDQARRPGEQPAPQQQVFNSSTKINVCFIQALDYSLHCFVRSDNIPRLKRRGGNFFHCFKFQKWQKKLQLEIIVKKKPQKTKLFVSDKSWKDASSVKIF